MEADSRPQSGASPPPAGGGSEQEEKQRLYTLPGLQGEWTMQQLVDMELQRDPRLAQVRRRVLPREFWDARRRALNHKRMQRNYGRRKRRGEALRQEEEERLAGMDDEQQAEYKRQKEEQREAAKAAAAQQRERVAEAMQAGLRVVVDCSFSADAPAEQSDGGTPAAGGEDGSPGSGPPPAASDREVRSLCKQLELCAAANKRAPRPVSLQFASFGGRVRAFALEGMHADRWPAARGHEAPLQQLFPASNLVVLSPDAQTPLLSLDPAKVYVIGGLVDRTVRKGATLKMAQRCGAQAVRLPVTEHLGGLAKPVLNVNDVFAVLLAVHGGEGWREALERAIPARLRQQQTGGLQAKGAQPPAESAGDQQPTSSPQAAAATAPSEAATEAECDQC